jgi:hypothetical protein
MNNKVDSTVTVGGACCSPAPQKLRIPQLFGGAPRLTPPASIVILSILFFLFYPTGIFAQSPTEESVAPTKAASGAASLIDKEIQNLKEKIATKVAELRKKNLKAIAGVVQENSNGVIKIKTINDDDYSVKIDDTLTKIYQIAGASKKELKVSDLKKKAYIIVTGPVSDKDISANFIYQDEQYLVKTGKITEINKEDEYIKVLSTEKDNYTLDVDLTTRIQLIDSKTLSVDTVKLAKLKEGDTIHFVVKKTGNEKEVNRYAADRLLVVPQEYFIK